MRTKTLAVAAAVVLVAFLTTVTSYNEKNPSGLAGRGTSTGDVQSTGAACLKPWAVHEQARQGVVDITLGGRHLRLHVHSTNDMEPGGRILDTNAEGVQVERPIEQTLFSGSTTEGHAVILSVNAERVRANVENATERITVNPQRQAAAGGDCVPHVFVIERTYRTEGAGLTTIVQQ